MNYTVFISYSAILVLSVDSQIFPAILSQLKGTSFQQGILLSALFFFFPIAAAGIGMLSDRIGKRPVLVAGSFLMAVPFIISSITGNYWIIILGVLLFGIGMGTVEGQTSALLSDSYPGKERSIMNISQTFFSIGAAGGPFLITLFYLVVPKMKLESIFTSAAITTIILSVGFSLLKTREAKNKALQRILISHLKDDGIWKFLAASLFIYVASEMGTVSWLAKYGHLFLGLSVETAPVCITLFWAGLGISRLTVGTLFQKFSSRNILLLSMTVTLIFQILTFLTLNPWIALPSILFIGIGMGPIWPTIVSIGGARYSGSNGFAVGALVAMGGLAVSLVQPLIGFLATDSILGLRFTLLSLSLLTIWNIIRIKNMYSLH